ncbi:aldehyde dehydrogenase family protein [Sphingobium sp. EM0848]|uniref:aldehyde dehydrogenase family protein n=1 Tax=Sphingobium sp. EM0848 TaxID=2743473 RepID=UPI00159C5C86|nr:aldehyde dehydrogenase family protein [Sphingobium sp. EM0848]
MNINDATLVENEERARQLLQRSWKLSIAGECRPALSGRTYAVTSPYTGEQIAVVPDGGAEDVAAAVTAAHAAFEGWRATPPMARAQLLEELARAIVAYARDFAILDSVDAGIPIVYMADELRTVAAFMRYFAGLALETKGETIPASNNLHFTERQPFGVVARIVPFNHPFMFAAKNIAAPLIAGNTVIVKPSELTPLSALLLGELVNEILPSGVVNVVVGNGPEVPQALVSHPLVHRIGFTGSEEIGRKIVRAGADCGVKDISLELGGKNAFIAFPDADPVTVAEAAIRNMNVTWSGQSCSSTTRLLVHEDIADIVVATITERLSTHVIGNPLDPHSRQGTIVSERQYHSILGFIERAQQAGARVASGGGRPKGVDTGLFIEPTVLVDVAPDSEVAQEEIFGPVLSVIRWRDEEEAIRIANSVRYGLTGIIYTNDIKRAHRVARKIDAGMIGINGSGAAFLGIPAGGFKASGLGREQSLDELLSYTQIKVTSVYLD